MATIKAFTDVQQSKKLAEILPIESADMYRVFENNAETRVYYGKPPTAYFVCEPCWSLAALLNVLQYPTLFQNGDEEWGCTVWIDTTKPYSISPKDNPVDACVEMIEKLHELNLL